MIEAKFMSRISVCFFSFSIFIFMNSCNSANTNKIIDEQKRNLLTIDKNWSDCSETEKAIGCWEAEPEKIDGTGNSRMMKGNLNRMLVFYSDGTLDDLTFYTIGLSKTDPLVYHYTDYSISGNYLTYKFAGKEYSRHIDVQSDKIYCFGRTYVRTSCLE